MQLKQLRLPGTKERLGLTVSALAVSAVLFMACGGTAAVNSGTTATGSGGSTSTAAAKHFKVGDAVNVGNTYQVTVNSFKTNGGDDVFQPKSGDEYVIVDVTIKNISSQEQDVSSELNFNFNDATGQKYSETIVDNATPPDGKVEAGALLRGQLAYEVPTSQHQFNLAFQSDAFSSGETLWDLSA